MSRVAVFKTVPFKRDSENIVWFNSRESQQDYFASLGGKSSFSALFALFPETNFIPMTDTLARIVIDSNDIGGILLDSLNYQYIIVEWTYNGITKYLYYFITDVKSKNIRTYEYSLELDIFNTYLRGVDWDLPLTLYIDRAHLLRYNYVNNELQPFFRDYWYNSEGLNPPTYFTGSERLHNSNNLWLYIIVKTALPNYTIDGITEQGSVKNNAFGWSNYRDLLDEYVSKSPYAIVWLPLSGSLKFSNGGDLTGIYGSTILYANAQQYLSPNVVGVFVSDNEPKDFTDNAVYTESNGTYTVTLSGDCKALYKELDGKIYPIGVCCLNYKFKRKTYDI